MTSLAMIATSDAAEGLRTLARSDCAAIHWARQSVENAVAVCPAGDRVAMEYALAAGIRIVEELEELPPAAFDVAYVGTGGAELVGDIDLARWAERSKASLLYDVIGCSEPRQDVREVRCDVGRGARYHVSVRGPLILVLSPRVARPVYVSRYRRHAAARQLAREPASVHGRRALRMRSHAWRTVRPRVRTLRGPGEPSTADDRLDSAFSIQAGDRNETTNVIVDRPEICARHVLRYLAHHGIVCRATSDDRLEVPYVGQASTAFRAAERQVTHEVVSLCAFMERRPRQADEAPARRVRQPRPAVGAVQLVSTPSSGELMGRRPRHAGDSSARLARQPRRLERP
jgi:hypothetical protein